MAGTLLAGVAVPREARSGRGRERDGKPARAIVSSPVKIPYHAACCPSSLVLQRLKIRTL
jgi:hypothetical protein